MNKNVPIFCLNWKSFIFVSVLFVTCLCLETRNSHSQKTNKCDQTITSDISKNGSFTSPNYPNSYPSNALCSYHFIGKGKERVQIIFSEFDTYKPDDTSRDCDNSDFVTASIIINGQEEKIDTFCGNELPLQLMSNGPAMIIQFKSQHNIDTNTNSKRFKATYRFVTNFGINSGEQDPQTVCGFNFNSSVSNNGSFISPNYPGFYPRDTECHYFFYADSSEKVYITFTHFDVEGVTPCTTETASDYVEFSNRRTVDREIPRHCGLKVPKTIESHSDFFRVTFKSNDRFDGTGFQAYYQFKSPQNIVTSTNTNTSSARVCLNNTTSILFIFVIIIKLFISYLQPSQ